MARELTEAAQVAKLIRKELRTRWPTVTFQVTSSNFAGGNSVDVHWMDGPTERQVNALVGKYQGGDFDGSIDLYIDRRDKPNHPTARWVQCQRSIGPATMLATASKVAHLYGLKQPEVSTAFDGSGYIAPEDDYPTSNGEYFSHLVYRTLQRDDTTDAS